MANKRDIMGLLTGIPREGISPLSQLTPQQMRAQAVQGGIEAMGRGMRGLMTGERRTPQQVQQANLRKLMSNIDLNSPEGLMKLAEIQKAQGDLSGAAQTVAKAQKLTNIANRKESLLKVAREQGNELIEEYILSAGDTDAALNKIQEVLFRRDPTFKSTAAPTKSDITLYEKLLEQYTDKELKALGIPTGFSFLTFGGGVDEADKLIIINNAKEIATNFPKLGKKAALAEALRQYGISKSAENMPTDAVTNESQEMIGAPINVKPPR